VAQTQPITEGEEEDKKSLSNKETGLARVLQDCLLAKKKCLVMYISTITLIITCFSYFEPLARQFKLIFPRSAETNATETARFLFDFINKTMSGLSSETLEIEGG
jgi:hypothetical protein